MSTHRVHVPGAVLAVHEPWPPPPAPAHPPLLVLHALALCASAYAPAVAGLAGERRVLLLDMRGHGASAGDGGGAADGGDAAFASSSASLWRTLADDVATVVATLSLTPCDVFAHSLGGGAAVLAAPRARFRRIVLFEPPRWPLVAAHARTDLAADNARFAAAAAALEGVTFPARDDAAAALALAPPFRWFDERVVAAFVDGGGVRPAADCDGVALAARARVVAAVAAALFNERGAPCDADYARLPADGSTTTIVVGPDRGGLTAFLRAGALAAAAACGRAAVAVDVVPGAGGHYGPLVDPDGVGRVVEGVLGGPTARL